MLGDEINARIERRFAECAVAHERRTPEPPLLYHYTDAKGLMGILTKAEMWASDYRFLNDSLELRYGMGVFDNRLRNAYATAETDLEKAFLNELIEHFPASMQEMQLYMACFCECGNLLSQWRAYGSRESAYSIGLDPNSLVEIARIRPPSLHTFRVEYEPAWQAATADGLIRTAVELAVELVNLLGGERADAFRWVRLHWQAWAKDQIARFKHQAFSEEREWRLVRVSHDRSGVAPELEFRPSRFGLTPYLTFDLKGLSGVFSGRLPVRRIVVGPCAEPMMARLVLYNFIEAKGLSNPLLEVIDSGAPLRV